MKFTKIAAVCLAAAFVFSAFTGCGQKPKTVITSKEDIITNKSKVAVQEGTTGDATATDAFKDSEIVRFKKAVDCGIDLKNGKVDAVVIDAMPAKKIVEQIKGLKILDEELTTEEYAIAVRKGDTETLTLINDTLKSLKDSNKYDDFYNAFIVPEAEKKPLAAREATSFADEIIMGTNAEFEPFEYRDNDKIVGFDVEVANEIALKAGKNLKIEDMNFDSLIPALTSKKVDMVIAGMSVTEERLQNVDFSDAYFSASQVIIVRDPAAK